MQKEVTRLDGMKVGQDPLYASELRTFLLWQGLVSQDASDVEVAARYRAFSEFIINLRTAGERVRDEVDLERAETPPSEIPRMTREMEKASVERQREDIKLRISRLTGAPVEQITLTNLSRSEEHTSELQSQ